MNRNFCSTDTGTLFKRDFGWLSPQDVTASTVLKVSLTQRNAMHKVTLLPGDGVGPEIAEATRKCVEATGVKIDWDVS